MCEVALLNNVMIHNAMIDIFVHLNPFGIGLYYFRLTITMQTVHSGGEGTYQYTS